MGDAARYLAILVWLLASCGAAAADDWQTVSVETGDGLRSAILVPANILPMIFGPGTMQLSAPEIIMTVFAGE